MNWKEISMRIINVENVDMKVNKIRFSKLKQQYTIRFIGAAITEYERNLQVVRDMFIDEDGVSHEFGVPGLIKDMQSEEIENNVKKNMSPREVGIRGLEYQIKSLQELSNELLAEEKYLELREAQEILEKLEIELKEIKNERI